MKISLDKHTVQQFFLDHFEKMIFGGIFLLVIFIIYGAFTGRPTFDQTPQNLIDRSENAQNSLKTERKLELDAPDYSKLAEKIATFAKEGSIPADAYESIATWNPPLKDQKTPRSTPPLFPVQKLQGSASQGTFQVVASARTPENSGSNASSGNEGKRWVVLTGLVPIMKQRKAFSETFRDSLDFDPANDLPVFMGYIVERAEIQSPADIENPKWSKTFPINFDVIKDKTANWGQSRTDDIEDKYFDDNLTFPLGPLTGKDWDDSIAHAPEIPLDSQRPLAQTANETQNETEESAAPDTDDPLSAFKTQRSRGPGRAGPGRSQQYPSYSSASSSGAPRQRGSDDNVQYKLFRFFDFDVNSGSQYIYRVRLVYKNPNYRKPSSVLAKPELSDKKILYEDSPWSEPSEVVSVSHDVRLLAGPAKISRAGLSCSMTFVKWIADTGKEVFGEVSNIQRGEVLNYKDQDIKSLTHTQAAAPTTTSAPSPTSGKSSYAELMARATASSTSSAPTSTSSSSTATDTTKADFITYALLVDLKGGEKLPGKDNEATAPAQILLLDTDGRFVLRNQVTDLANVEQLNASLEGDTSPSETPSARPSRSSSREAPSVKDRLMNANRRP